MGNNRIKDNNIFIMGVWLDTEEKKRFLISSIERIRENYQTDILLVSHYLIPPYIQDMVEYCIYDRNNLLLYQENYSKYNNISNISWYTYGGIRIETIFPFRYDYAAWSSTRNAVNFAKYIGKENIFYLEYDSLINCEEFKKEFIDPLAEYDVCILDGSDFGKGCCYFSIYSIKTNLAVNVFNQFRSMDNYYNSMKDISTASIECVFMTALKSNSKLIYNTHKTDGLDMDNFSTPNNYYVDKNGFRGYIYPCVDLVNKNYYLSIIYSPSQSMIGKECKIFVKFLGINQSIVVRNDWEIKSVYLGQDIIYNLLEKEIEIYNEYGDIFKISLNSLRKQSMNNFISVESQEQNPNIYRILEDNTIISLLTKVDILVNIEIFHEKDGFKFLFNFVKDLDKNVDVYFKDSINNSIIYNTFVYARSGIQYWAKINIDKNSIKEITFECCDENKLYYKRIFEL
jgi:hypothetical protein